MFWIQPTAVLTLGDTPGLERQLRAWLAGSGPWLSEPQQCLPLAAAFSLPFSVPSSVSFPRPSSPLGTVQRWPPAPESQRQAVKAGVDGTPGQYASYAQSTRGFRDSHIWEACVVGEFSSGARSTQQVSSGLSTSPIPSSPEPCAVTTAATRGQQSHGNLACSFLASPWLLAPVCPEDPGGGWHELHC